MLSPTATSPSSDFWESRASFCLYPTTNLDLLHNSPLLHPEKDQDPDCSQQLLPLPGLYPQCKGLILLRSRSSSKLEESNQGSRHSHQWSYQLLDPWAQGSLHTMMSLPKVVGTIQACVRLSLSLTHTYSLPSIAQTALGLLPCADISPMPPAHLSSCHLSVRSMASLPLDHIWLMDLGLR